MTATIANPPFTTAKPARMLSLDVLRGLTIGFMILVNNNADGVRAYWALKHAVWNGFTPTDLVFPTFLFLVGIATVFSTSSRIAQGASRQSLFGHVVRRTILLYLFGLLVNSFPFFNPHTLRFYGVLPRIAICYFLVATLYLLSPKWFGKAVLLVACLVGYWWLMRFISVPGYGLPVRDVPLLDPDGNLTAWLDRRIFSPSHLYEGTRDPEGLLSTIPALGTALLGMLTGLWLKTRRSLLQKVRGVAIAGITCALLGGLWNYSFPINKKLWTSSFVLFAGGLSLLLLALSMWIVDIDAHHAQMVTTEEINLDPERRSRRYMVLLVFGMNAIAAYVLSELLPGILSNIHIHPSVNVTQWVYGGILSVIPNVPFASLLYSLLYVAVCWVPMYVLYRRRIFLKL